MSEPTPVISRAKDIDSGSSGSPIFTSSVPTEMKVNRSSPAARPSMPASWNVHSRAITTAAATVAVPSRWPQRSVRRPPSSSTAAPASGSAMSSQEAASSPAAGSASGTSQLHEVWHSRSVLEQVGVVDRGGPAGPVDRHDDREADHDLSGGDDHHEEGDDLAVDRAGRAGEGDQGQVDRVEHQLDAHEDDDRVAPHQHADGADGEQDRREHEVVAQGHRSSPWSRLPPSKPPGTPLGVPSSVPRESSGLPSWRRPSGRGSCSMSCGSMPV